MCAQACVGDLGGCAMGDVSCICSNSAYLSRVSTCISQNCPLGQCQRECNRRERFKTAAAAAASGGRYYMYYWLGQALLT